VIETERLLMRRLSMADVDGLLDLYSDPEVRRYIHVPDGYGREHAIARIEADTREWDDLGHRFLAVTDRKTGRFLGRVAVYDWPQFGETEVGWILHPAARGQGFATEAGAAALTWGFENLDVPYLTAMISPDNKPSLRVADRLGMRRLREDGLGEDQVIVHAVRSEDWLGKPCAVPRQAGVTPRQTGDTAGAG
jgi:RimJ/RimL family protein N-acetyltransferase